MTVKIKNLEVLTFAEFQQKYNPCQDHNCSFEQYIKSLPKEVDVSDWDKLEIPKWILAKYFEVFSCHRQVKQPQIRS